MNVISGCCMRIVMLNFSIGSSQIQIIVYFNFGLLNVILTVDRCILEVIVTLSLLLQHHFINLHL
jgi:hypothetical protein